MGGNWKCAAGYVGYPTKRCRTVGLSGCDLRMTLDGCYRGANVASPMRYRLIHVSGDRTLSSSWREVHPSEISERKANSKGDHGAATLALLEKHDAAILMQFSGPGCYVARTTHKAPGKDRAFAMAESYAQAFVQQCETSPTVFYA